jgi:DNA topoisomerase-1
MGIGRPSTYAAIIETILARDYVTKRGNALVPTWTAFAVSQLLEAHLPNLVDYRFTAQMEDELDAISRGETGHIDYLRSFYFGNGKAGLKKQLENKVEEIDARDVSRILLGQPEGSDPIFVRVGRFGPFLEQGPRRASIPDGFPPDELTLETSLKMLDQAAQGDEPLGICPETGKPVFLKVGRFGPYVQRGTTEGEEKPQNASLLKGMTPANVDLATALKLLTLPRELGVQPTSGEKVMAFNGRFGPYVKCGSETRSLPSDLSPIDVTLEQALALLAEPKKARRGFGAAREPLKELGVSPITNEKVQLFEGRYGQYVADGVTNASVPKGTAAEELTLPKALELLADRAAKGPSPKAARRKAAAKKSGKPKAETAKSGKPEAKSGKRKAESGTKKKASTKKKKTSTKSDSAPF